MFENLLKTLEATIAELNECVSFIEFSNTLRPRLNEILNWEYMSEAQQTIVRNFISCKTFRSEISYAGLFVVTHATFESIIRQLIEEIVVIIGKKSQKFDDLDEIIKKNNVAFTGQFLSTIHSPSDYTGLDYYDQCQAIGTAYPGSNKLSLTPKVFSYNAGSLTCNNIEKLFKRVSINLDWDEFGRDQKLRDIFQSNTTRDVANEVKGYLNEMVKQRNKIAHTGTLISDIDRNVLNKQELFIKSSFSVMTLIAKASVT